MKNRKKGFSLVELLIVLAVMAALIATITPVALNAIKKSKATQVAQNLKTLASALENAAYVNGVSTVVKNADGTTITLADLGRDIDSGKYGFAYAISSGVVTAKVYYIGADVDDELVIGTLPTATTTKPSFTPSDSSQGGVTWDKVTSGTHIIYPLEFTVY
jgi:type IV pilus assembly protein PilA